MRNRCSYVNRRALDLFHVDKLIKSTILKEAGGRRRSRSGRGGNHAYMIEAPETRLKNRSHGRACGAIENSSFGISLMRVAF
jgi:hypothetical protein